jgi:DNA polymerase
LYYRSIFNPARVKVKAMQSEMPKKYWANLPEAELIGGLIAESRTRVEGMLEAKERPVKPVPNNAYLKSLRSRSAEEPGAGP